METYRGLVEEMKLAKAMGLVLDVVSDLPIDVEKEAYVVFAPNNNRLYRELDKALMRLSKELGFRFLPIVYTDLMMPYVRFNKFPSRYS